MVKPRQVILKLEGGLGNQLFQLAAGYLLAAKVKSNLVIDQYSIPLSTVHGEREVGFSEFDIKQIANGGKIIVLENLPNKFLVKWASRSPNLKRLLIKIRMKTSNPQNLKHFFELNEPNSTDDFLGVHSPVKLHGNFQSWRIVQKAAEYGFPKILHLKVMPIWIEELERTINPKKSMVLHFRVGDDTRANYNFKQPEISYYLSALRILSDRVDFADVYILSDDINRVKEMFGSKLDKGFQYLVMPDESSPAERLYVMSLFGGIVCANSTFCGWAAWSISNSGGEVVVPVPYSDGPVLGSRDFPSHWITLDKYSGAEVS
jgi:hypothetical protein